MLFKDGRASYADIASEIGFSVPATRDRVLKLRRDGFIEGFRVRINYEKIGFTIQALIFVKLSVDPSGVKDQLKKIPNILRCCPLVGEEDLLLEIIARDQQDLVTLTGKIRSIEGVVGSSSTVLLPENFSQSGIF
jgi:Lrp/AsnC family leucine-responsive transcriptional regulator